MSHKITKKFRKTLQQLLEEGTTRAMAAENKALEINHAPRIAAEKKHRQQIEAPHDQT